MRIRAFALCLLPFLLVNSVARAQKTESSDVSKRFIGMWKLVSISDPEAERRQLRGPKPTGYIVYDASGIMTVQIMPTTRPKYEGTVPTPNEAKAAITGYTAYFGTWTVDQRAGTITHHITGSIVPNNLGVDNVRKYEFGPGERVTLIPIAPVNSGTRLTWEKMK